MGDKVDPMLVTLNIADGSGWHVAYGAGVTVDVGRLTNYSRSPEGGSHDHGNGR